MVYFCEYIYKINHQTKKQHSVLQYQQELKRRDCKLSVGGYLLGWPRAAVSDYAASSVTALPFESLYCSVQGAPRRAKGKALSGASSACVVANPSFFCGGKREIRQSVVFRATYLRPVVVCLRKSLSSSDDCL